ncbi:hypothetical protein SAY87_024538 [Trapa incisa]|uniref:non-specific serine/threonine protein kinase n=1 Tax=Trapa incisa TaxID=236973 RepID=A0AAN7JFU7_9MYRT|nr:hypothetical protein SAY87_024538 [Trapa incisa]
MSSSNSGILAAGAAAPPRSIHMVSGLITLLLCLVTSSCSGILPNQTDREALLEFKAQLVDPLGALDSWNASVHFCQWAGVSCGRKHERVTALTFISQGLGGTIAAHIGNLSFLRVLNLQNNSFQSRIPPEIGRLARLQRLYLNINSLSGEIPWNLSYCSRLVRVNLGFNKLEGKLPAALGSLYKLESLNLQANTLRGEIPHSFGNLSSLMNFSLTENNLCGRFPNELGNLRNLNFLSLEANGFTGDIPSSLFNVSSIQMIAVADNRLQGSLPNDIGTTLPNLKSLGMSNNSFTGSIPQSISNASNLMNFEIVLNNFSGRIPSFGNMRSLQWFNIGQNQFGSRGANDLNFLCSLTNSTALQTLGIESNNFGGSMPECVGNLSKTLSAFAWSYNPISGSLPAAIGNLVNLEVLNLEGNKMSGIIPSEIGHLKSLSELDLSRNDFSGKLPHSLGNLTLLTELYLYFNDFHGPIPSSLSECQNLILLDMGGNSLSGTIPPGVMGLSSLSIYADFSENNLTGELPSEVGKLINLDSLRVYGNRLSGKIPSSIGNCEKLEILLMEDNLFEGSIPSTLSSLKGIQVLNLSNNRLSGKIPEFLEDLPLISLDLSFNDFEGLLPTEGVFRNASAISIVRNKNLCGGLPQFHLQPCKTDRSTRRNRSANKVRNIIICSVAGLLGTTFLLLFLCVWFRKEKKEVASGELAGELMKVSYQSLMRVTDGFSATNLIGVGSFGSVFRGVLHPEQITVAIKVLDLKRHGASKSFSAECEALRNVRHRNLVKILTACSSLDFKGNDFKALVYEFMVNGSLDEWLHPSVETTTEEAVKGARRPLGLLERLNIAIDVALALDYLHHRGEMPIIHCDLKPTNILLDGQMVAHVGDFGLARILPEATQELITSSVGIKGTFGYIAPEYGAGGGVSTIGDVYSYGVLVLEIFTGKRPTDEMFRDGLNLHSFARAALPGQVSQIVDPFLLQEIQDSENSGYKTTRRYNTVGDKVLPCLVSIIEKGVVCSSEHPRDRMDISSVVSALQAIRDGLLPGRK